MRAIANYDEGLKKYKDAFDLAYNKYVVGGLDRRYFYCDPILTNIKANIQFLLEQELNMRSLSIPNWLPSSPCHKQRPSKQLYNLTKMH